MNIIKKRAGELREYSINKLKEKYGNLLESGKEIRNFCVAVISIVENFPLIISKKHIDKMLHYDLNSDKNLFFIGNCTKKSKRYFVNQDENELSQNDSDLYPLVHNLLHLIASKDLEYRFLQSSYNYNSDVNYVEKSLKLAPRDEETDKFTKILYSSLNYDKLTLPQEMTKGLILICEGGFCLGSLKYDGNELLDNENEVFAVNCFGYEGMVEYLTQQVVGSPECKQNAQYFGVDINYKGQCERFGIESGFMYILNCVYYNEFQEMFFEGVEYAQHSQNLNNEDLMSYIYYCNKWTNELNSPEADEEQRELFLNGLADYTKSCLQFLNYQKLKPSQIYNIKQSLISMYLASNYNNEFKKLLENFALSHYYNDDVENLLEEKGLEYRFLENDFAERSLNTIYAAELNFEDEIVNGNINDLLIQSQNRNDIDGWLNFTKRQLKRLGRDSKDYFKFLNHAKVYAEKRGDPKTSAMIADKIALDTEKSLENLFKTISQKIKIYNNDKLKYSYYLDILSSMLDFLKKKSKYAFKEELYNFINNKHQDVLTMKTIIEDNELQNEIMYSYNFGKSQNSNFRIQDAIGNVCVKLETDGTNPLTREIVSKIENGINAMNVAEKIAILNSKKQTKKNKG